VRTPRAEVGLARQRERRGPLPERLEERHARGDRFEVDAPLEARGDDLRDAVGVELGVGGHEGPALEVVLAGDARADPLVVEDLADEELAEGALLLDDEQLVQAVGELAHGRRLHREAHPDLHEPHAVAAQRRVVEPEPAQRLAHVVVGLAGGRDAEPRLGRVECHAVQPVRGAERLRGLQAPVVDLALRVEPPRRHQQRVLPLLPGAALVEEARVGDHDAVGGDLGGADLVGDVGHDLDADPEAGVARELEAEAAEVEDLLHGAGEEDGEEGVVERDLRVRGDRGRFRQRVVAAQRQHAAEPGHAGEVGVLEDVAGAVDARPLAVPHPEDAVVLRPGEEVDELAAVDRRRAEVFVDAGEEHHVVLAQELRVPLEREVEPAERRAAVARDQRGGPEAPPPVGLVLVERQADERLDAGQEDGAFVLAILGVEGKLGLGRHGPPRLPV
jgi:hypothetical protein